MKSASLAIVVLSVILGCSGIYGHVGGAACNQVCAAANACSLQERSFDVECAEYCADADRVHAIKTDTADGTVCKELFDAHIKCWNDNRSKICHTAHAVNNKKADAAFTECAASGTAWRGCLNTYCKANSTDPSCNPPTKTAAASSALLPF